MTVDSPVRKPTKSGLAADKLLKQLGLLAAPVDLELVADSLGISSSFDVLDDGISGFLIVRNGKAGICVNALHHPNRQRFTFAHEIGHFYLHHSKNAKDDIYIDRSLVYLRGKQKGYHPTQASMEREADEFAASLLMPESVLTSYITTNGLNPNEEIDLYRLTVAFKVSEQAMSIRLSELGILG